MFKTTFAGEKSYAGLLEAIFDSVVDGIVVSDEKGLIIAVNPAMEQIFGHSAPELAGQNVSVLMTPDNGHSHDRYIENYASTGDKKIIGIGREVEGRHKNGTIFPMYLGISEIDTDRGKGYVGIIRDLSEQTRALELETSKKAAEHANAAKDQFLSRMSHELRTPLNAVIGFTQLIQMRFDDPRIQEATDAILRAGNHLLGLINEVLDLSRIENGRLTLSVEPVQLANILQQSIELIKPQAGTSGITLIFSSEYCADSRVIADRQKLLQVFINLLSNAVKFNRQNGTIELWCEELSGQTLGVFVRDSGIGIPKECLPRLFQPFERFATSVAEGTGLGLALSCRFLELMGGSLELVSSTPAGSTFLVTLNLADEDPEGNNETQEVDLPGVTMRFGKVLCIEDNLSNFRLIEMALDRWKGITLIPAMQGTVGLELAASHRPHVILLDIHLPDIAGGEVLARLKSRAETADIPVIVISADASEKQIRRMIRAGAHEFIAKPLNISKFLGILWELLPGQEGKHS